jgi:hypothetical protein
MTDGVLVGVFAVLIGAAFGVGIGLYFWMRQDARDEQWGRIVQQQQAQIEALTEYIADHSEATAEGLGYDD